MNITEYSVEKLLDPTGILTGDRYEFILDIEVDEDDELHSEQGVYIKLILAIEEDTAKIPQYQIFERVTDTYLDFALEDEELEEILQFCKENIVE
jgi:hypothetical protein